MFISAVIIFFQKTYEYEGEYVRHRKKETLLMEKRLKETENDQKLHNDEDFLFLRSILPSMKKLTELQKLEFRGKINQWLYETTERNQITMPGYYPAQQNQEIPDFTLSLTFL